MTIRKNANEISAWDHWTLMVKSQGNVVTIQPVKGFMRLYGPEIKVYPPGTFDRWRGITQEMKIDKAIQKAQDMCDRWNKHDKMAEEIIEKNKERLNK